MTRPVTREPQREPHDYAGIFLEPVEPEPAADLDEEDD